MFLEMASSPENLDKNQTLNGSEACELISRSPQELLSHLHTSFSLKNDAIEHSLTDRQISEKSSTTSYKSTPCSDEELLLCNSCNKRFKNSRGLKQHIGKIHSDELKSFGCWKCGKKFKSKHALKAHKSQVHERANITNCEICCLTFSSKYIKNEHIRKVHQLKLT